MNTPRALLFVVLLVRVSSGSLVCAQESKEPSVAQLKAQIAVLEATDRDPATLPEIKELNRSFLKQRRIQLKALLQKRADALRTYLANVGPSLNTDEKQLVEESIRQAEADLQAVAREVQASSAAEISNALPTAVASSQPQLADLDLVRPGGPANNANTTDVASVENSTLPNSVTGATTSTVQPPASGSTSFNAELNALIRAKARVDQTDNTKQTETPSIGANSTSLVDQSSASDLIGLATNFAGLSASSNDNQKETSSVSVTTSAYALLAAMNRVDPLNPVFYDNHRAWRNFSVTLGYDDEDQADGTRQRAKLLGAKFLFINKRDPNLERNKKAIDTLTASLANATASFGNLAIRSRGFVLTLESVRTSTLLPEFKEFLEQRRTKVELDLERERNKLASATTTTRPDLQKRIDTLEATETRIDTLLKASDDTKLVVGSNFLPASTWTREELEYRTIFFNKYLGQNYRDKLGKEAADAVEKFVDEQLDAGELIAFRNLDSVGSSALEYIRRAPQLSVAFFTKQRKIGLNEYLGEAIFDYGLANRINLTLNGAYSYKDSKVIGGDQRGFVFGGQLQFQLNRENLLGKKPFYLNLSTNGNWTSGTDAIYKAQGKISIPIADGIDFPVSVTYSNQADDLLKESTVKGQFGFSIDTARLIRAFLFR